MIPHRITDVPRLDGGRGTVVLTHHAKERFEQKDVDETEFLNVLWNGKDRPESHNSFWRELHDLRIVILRPQPYRGTHLIKTIVRVRPLL